MKTEKQFRQAGPSGSGQQVSEVRFDGADAHFVVGEFLVPVNLSQCVDLDGIADPGSRAMGFDIADAGVVGAMMLSEAPSLLMAWARIRP